MGFTKDILKVLHFIRLVTGLNQKEACRRQQHCANLLVMCDRAFFFVSVAYSLWRMVKFVIALSGSHDDVELYMQKSSL